MPYLRFFAEQLLEHLFVVGHELPPPDVRSTDCHVYIVEGKESALAVDAGGGNLWPYVKAVIEAHGFAEKPISHVLVTHGHGDHARGLTAFENQGALTVSSDYAADHLESAEDADVIFERNGVLDLGEFQPEAILTPGHTPGSASYRVQVDDTICLFVGDLIQADGGLGWCGAEGFNQEQVLASLKKLVDISPPPDLMLTGHFIIRDPLAVLRRGIKLGEGGHWVAWTDDRPDLSRVKV